MVPGSWLPKHHGIQNTMVAPARHTMVHGMAPAAHPHHGIRYTPSFTIHSRVKETQHKHKKPPQLQPCNGRWLNGGGIWGVRPSGFTREGLRMHRKACAVAGSESLPTHAPRLLVWYGVSPLKNRGYSSFKARRPHQAHLHRMALVPPNALPTLRTGRRGSLRGPHTPGSASPRPGLPAWG